jgi:hypothetical protein
MVKRQKSMHELRHGGSPGILSRLWAGIETRIPFGYQTKTGFHYGTESIASLLERLGEVPVGFLTV